MKTKKSQPNTDDKTTVILKNTDGETTVVLGDQDRKTKNREAKVSQEEMKVIRAYWTSGSPALKRQAISRYALIMGLNNARAEAALNEFVHLLEQSK